MKEAALWVDTDFGFDDLWALLLLRHLGIEVAGLSLVSGNSPLPQVFQNASSAQHIFEFDWPLYSGASSPLKQPMHTAQAVLGDTGMQTRGLALADIKTSVNTLGAQDALRAWLGNAAKKHHVLALGPLTNLALLATESPELFNAIDRICWMGGSAGRGNQTPWAEFNAFADPEAMDIVLSAGVPVDMVDLELCRKVAFAEHQMPTFDVENSTTQALLRDLLGGYLDIALQRGLETMAIYDPVAVIVYAEAASVEFAPCTVDVELAPGKQLGRTVITPIVSSEEPASCVSAGVSLIRLGSAINSVDARNICMSAFQTQS